jgi:hypothetical protein
VVDDIGFFNAGPYDGTNIISANTSAQFNKSGNPIRSYVTSAGNEADKHYQEPYSACSSSTLQKFQATSNTLDLGGFGPRCTNPIFVAAGATAKVFLEWNDPFGASCNDYDLFLYVHDTATLLASSTNAQSCTQNPTEQIMWTNPLSSDVIVDVAINASGSPSPRTFDLFTLSSDPNFDTPSSSVPAESDAAGGVLSVGAVGASDPGTIEFYSSLGPTNDGRTKPDITGVDCVSVTGAGGFTSDFCGTSAAAPHIAGIAALLLQCKPSLKAGEPGDNPSADRTALRTGLLNNAVDLGSPGTDNVFGAGRADAQASANAVCPSTTPTPSPTPTHSPTPTPTHSPTPTPTHSPTPTPTSGQIKGDLNCDRFVNMADVTLGLKLVAGLGTSTQCTASPDVDCNGIANGLDVLDLLRFVVHLPSLVTGNCPAIGSS